MRSSDFNLGSIGLLDSKPAAFATFFRFYATLVHIVATSSRFGPYSQACSLK
jgi:hypothetical protein